MRDAKANQSGEAMTREEENVLDANEKFYRALQDLNVEAMEAVWLPADWVRCIHPGWEALEGWEAVRESWQQIFANTQFLRIVVGVQSVHVENSMAWVCCTEKISSATNGRFETANVQSTNVFKRQNGVWYLVHHHASHRPTPWPEQGAAEVVQ